MTAGQRKRPANMAAIVATNQGRMPLTRSLTAPPPLTPTRVAELLAAGHVLVDTRSSEAFAEGHVPGAYHVHRSSSEFEQRVGWVLPGDAPVVLLVDADAEALDALRRLAFVAMDGRVVGYLEDGVEGWRRAGMRIEEVPLLEVREVHRRLAAGDLRVLDVREPDEWDEGHVEGAVLAPYGDLVEGADAPPVMSVLDPHAELAVVCATGKRSSTAISLLLRQGFTRVHNVVGGMEAWRGADLPRVDGTGRACSR